MENIKLRNLQSQINEMKRDKQVSDEANRLLLQQVLEAQTHLNKVYAQMSNLQSINNDLHQQIHSHSIADKPPNDPDLNPTMNNASYHPHPTSHPQPKVGTSSETAQPSLNQALLDMLHAQRGYFENKTDTSSLLTKFPTFQGKSSTEFRTWYDKILSILATPPWTPVFSNIQSKQLHTDDSISPDLSSKLYSKLRTAMTGNAEKVMMSKPEVWGKGLLYLSTIKSTYQEILQRGDVLKKREEFSALMQKPTETIDDFGARCIFLQKQLVDHGLTISTIELKDTFIMGLGPLFTRIQQCTEPELPIQWQTSEMQLLINAAKSFKASVEAVRERNKKFTKSFKNSEEEQEKDTKSNPDPRKPSSEKPTPNDKDQERQAKIRQEIIKGIFSPRSHFKSVKPNCCVWHNTDTHNHQQCNEIAKLLAQYPNQKYYFRHLQTHHQNQYQRPNYQQPNNSNTQYWTPSTHGSNQPNWRRQAYPNQVPPQFHQSNRNNFQTNQPNQQSYAPQPPRQPSVTFNQQNNPSARHTSMNMNPDQAAPNVEDPTNQLQIDELDLQDLQAATDALGNIDNNNNSTVNRYFLTCKNVTIRNDASSQQDKTNMSHFIIDSAAFPHMCNNANMFHIIKPWTQGPSHVQLADGTSKAEIQGIGDIHMSIGTHNVHLKDVLYVPALSDSLFSAKLHAQEQGHYIHIEKDVTTIAFKAFIHTIKNNQEIVMKVCKYTPSACKTSPSTSGKVNRQDKQPIPHFNPLLQVPFKRMSTSARKPIRATDGSAGHDLYSSRDIIIPAGARTKINTDIKVSIPIGYYGRIAPRSGMSMKSNIDIAAGVIDCDYTGEIFPCLINNGEEPFIIKKHDRIAQLIFEKIGNIQLQEVEELLLTKRSEKGFGSTTNPHIAPSIKNSNAPTKTHKSTYIFQKLLNPGLHKVTMKFPWNETFSKVHIQKNENGFLILENNDLSHIFPKINIQNLIGNNKLLLGHHHLISKISTNPTNTQHVYPPVRTVDKPITNATHQTVFSIDQLRKGFGFRGVQNIIKELQETSTNFRISTLDRETIVDLGEISTIDAPARNTNVTDLPTKLGDVVHMDIIFGSNTAIGGTKYALFLVDKATRHKFIYPLTSVKHDHILSALQQFEKDIGIAPKILRTDFDYKLMGKQVVHHFANSPTQLEAAPPDQQNQNGLCERNWRSILRMARSWLANSLLPSNFWWHSIKRATEVANYIPLKIDGQLTTPHELTYGHKVDLRNILPLFAVSYIRNNTDSNSMNSNSIRTILIGRSSKSHTYEFYHPATKKIISSSIYRIDETIPAGPTFNLQYDGGMYFNKFNENYKVNKSPTYSVNENAFVLQNNHSLQVKIIAIPITNDDIYTVQFQNGSIHQLEEKYIHKGDPNSNPIKNDPPPSSLPRWLKHSCKCTIFLNTMTEPCQGKLFYDNIWRFIPNNRIKHHSINFPYLERDLLHLLQTFQCFSGHVPAWKVWQTRTTFNMGNIFARHVSANGLTSQDVPNLIHHSRLNEKDRSIWDAAYSEEYYGLKNLPTWKTITESEYQRNKSKLGTILPTMAISTIKYDENGNPKRAKYRIVALGNLDPHIWRKEECYAPVMSLMELRFLTALAVRQNKILKSGDFKQAFCQAILPPGENYVLRPPHGCPLTPKGSYWMLQRTLYGLKRSPRHWYEKAVQLLTQIGLKQCPNAPCLFKGTLIKGKAPIYLGLYVDDFVYFSTDKEVESKFEKELGSLTNVDFMGQVSHFLGIKYQWRQTPTSTKAHMSQEAFAESLVNQNGLSNISTKINMTPYRSGFPVDAIPQTNQQISKSKQ